MSSRRRVALVLWAWGSLVAAALTTLDRAEGTRALWMAMAALALVLVAATAAELGLPWPSVARPGLELEPESPDRAPLPVRQARGGSAARREPLEDPGALLPVVVDLEALARQAAYLQAAEALLRGREPRPQDLAAMGEESLAAALRLARMVAQGVQAERAWQERRGRG